MAKVPPYDVVPESAETVTADAPRIEGLDIDELSRRLAVSLGLKTSLAKTCLTETLRNIKKMDGKQLDYGCDNLLEFGTFGVLVRFNDKFARLKSLMKSGKVPNNESLQDSWLDASNYALIGSVIQSGAWGEHNAKL